MKKSIQLLLISALSTLSLASYASCTYQIMPNDPYTVTTQVWSDNGYDTHAQNNNHTQCWGDTALPNAKLVTDAYNRFYSGVAHYSQTIETGMNVDNHGYLTITVSNVSTVPISWHIDAVNYKANGTVKETKSYNCKLVVKQGLISQYLQTVCS